MLFRDNKAMDALTDAFAFVQQWLFENLVQPVSFALGQGHLLETAYEGTGWLVVGLLQIAVMLVVIGPLQKRWPVEPMADARAVKVDILYTVIHRLGLFKLVMFFTLETWFENVWGQLRTMGLPTWHLDQVWPGVTDQAVVSFVIYLVFFDFVNYWMHRAQHQSARWWALHAMHHAQRQMTMWSDNRNHLLDDVITSLLLAAVAMLVGVGPGQFVALVAVSQLSENFQHANVRMWFGRVGERLNLTSKGAKFWAAATSVCSCPGGTCCLAQPTFSCATTPPACAIRLSKAAITAKAFGRNSGLACCGCWAGPDGFFAVPARREATWQSSVFEEMLLSLSLRGAKRRGSPVLSELISLTP
jgi:sterol desaturase/sphingolipid hydroxylase (fatty acid hydroxylase superfamily)